LCSPEIVPFSDSPLLEGMRVLSSGQKAHQEDHTLHNPSSTSLKAARRNDPKIYGARSIWKGRQRACRGPRDRNLDRANPEDMVLAYPGLPKDFPFPMYGSYDALGLDGFSCMDRYTRFGAYGYSGTDSQLQGARPLPPVDWKKVNWRTLQEECFERNSDRYESAQQSLSMHSLPLTSVSHETLPDTAD
jgi:hypothetical protein